MTEPGEPRRDVACADLTTFGIGGPADVVLDVSGADAAVAACARIRQEGTDLTFLGGGSNVLVSDLGVRGALLRFRGGQITREAPDLVRGEAGVSVNGLVRWCIGHGLGGFEAWAGTPGTLGGAVYGNAHFQGRLMSEVVVRACLLDRGGHFRVEPVESLGFAYDVSRLQTTGEALLWVEIRVHEDDPLTLRTTAKESLTFRKRTQPLSLRSAGCIFQNPEAECVRLPGDVPCSAGALIDRVGLKGERRGGARISPVHANFFVNEGGARAADVVWLIHEARRRVMDAFGIELREEIVRLGDFQPD
ncbi:MAG: UDP-N-acetylmuramate dehydrogenase [Vicinamibacteria bacterium]|nr:UDP-N-acetylmuramate dehydrogenase [Vicinamibacteria bacterium]